MTYEQLVEIWLDAVQQRKLVDYADRNSVEKYNHCTDRYRKIARQIDDNYRDKIASFSEFLDADDTDVRVACAFCLLELTHYPIEVEARALEVIKLQAETAWDAIGYSLWLDDWENGRIKTQYTR